AFGVERAMLALDRQGSAFDEPVPELLLFSGEEDRSALFQAAAAVRADGITIELGIDATDWQRAKEIAARRGIQRIGKVSRRPDGTMGVEAEQPGEEDP